MKKKIYEADDILDSEQNDLGQNLRSDEIAKIMEDAPEDDTPFGSRRDSLDHKEIISEKDIVDDLTSKYLGEITARERVNSGETAK